MATSVENSRTAEAVGSNGHGNGRGDVATFVIGIALALYLPSARPDRYAAIGRTILDDPGEELVSDVSGDGSSDRVPAGTGAWR